MRLTRQEQLALIEATKACFGQEARVWLFGSRVDNEKSGGDIDIYIETPLTTGIFAAKLAFRQLIWTTFGDQKVDLIVGTINTPPQPFHELAKKSGLELTTTPDS